MYASLGASDDITQVRNNAFSQFVAECKLADKHSTHCKPTHFDQLFVAVDASNANGKTDERYNAKKALNRQEWLQCLVKIAIMKFVQSKACDDVSEALFKLMQHIEPRLDTRIFIEPNDFRATYLYHQATDEALRRHECEAKASNEASSPAPRFAADLKHQRSHASRGAEPRSDSSLRVRASCAVSLSAEASPTALCPMKRGRSSAASLASSTRI